MAAASQIGLAGLAVMGQNLALNIADKGFPFSVYNRTSSKVDETVKPLKMHDFKGRYGTLCSVALRLGQGIFASIAISILRASNNNNYAHDFGFNAFITSMTYLIFVSVILIYGEAYFWWKDTDLRTIPFPYTAILCGDLLTSAFSLVGISSMGAMVSLYSIDEPHLCSMEGITLCYVQLGAIVSASLASILLLYSISVAIWVRLP